MKPQDFFINTRDFFAVIVPGALLMILVGAINPELNLWLLLQKQKLGPNSGILNILICFVCTYSLGTVLSGVGSRLDWVADRITLSRIAAADRREKVGFGLRKMDKLRQTEALAHALEITLAPGLDKAIAGRRPWSTRAFWWNYLRLNCAEAMVELDRIEGQQKQYRGMTIGALVMVAVYYVNGASSLTAVAVVATLFLAYSYWSQRNRFARRLFELAIVHAVPKMRFDASGDEFFKAVERWEKLMRARVASNATTLETDQQ